MNEMENLGDGLREELSRVFKLIDLDSPTEIEDDWISARKAIESGDVVKMHMMYEKLKTWK